MKLELPNWGSLCNPNLLLNSDFRSGIINQKGQTSYTNNGSYTIDMWQISGSCGLVVKDGYIQFYKGTGIAKFRQLFTSNPLSGDFTFTVRLTSGTSSNKMYIQNSAGKITEKVIPIGQDVTMQYSGDIKEIGILSSEENGSCYIKFMKLEYGNYFTGMPAWNKDIEYIRCQANYLRIQNTQATLSLAEIRITGSDTARLVIKTTEDVRKGPTINIQNIFVVQYNDGVWRQVNRITSINYSRNYILIDLQTSVSTLDTKQPCYLLINTNGYIEIDMYEY